MEYQSHGAMTRAEALAAYRELWRPEPRVETVPLDRAFGRVLAEDLVGQCDLPVVRASRYDGYAMRSADFAVAAEDAGIGGCAPASSQGVALPDTSSWREGSDFARADTGDDFPDAFDMVVAIESTERTEDGGLRLVPDGKFAAGPGAGVSPRGSISRKGDPIAPAHLRLTPEAVAAAAVGGYAQLRVFSKPRVAFIPTGTELVAWGSYPQRGQNIEANSLLVQGLLEQWGAEAIVYPVMRDTPDQVAAALERALDAADIVLLNAGSSRGGEDFNAELLQGRASYFRHGVKTVPGRPVGMAIIDGKPVVNAPGPVLAAWLCLDWLVRGLVAHWYGTPTFARRRVRARVTRGIVDPKPRERIVRMTLAPDPDDGSALLATPVGALGVPQTLVQTDALFTLPADCDGVEEGEEVEVELLRPMELVHPAGR